MSSNGSAGCGMIGNAGGDKHAYLGHFRGTKVLERGHNAGAPGYDTGGSNGGRMPGAPPTNTQNGGKPAPRKPKQVMEKGGGFGTPRNQKKSAGMGVLAGDTSPAAPMKPTFDPVKNPIRASRQQNKTRLATAQASDAPGAVKAARTTNQANLAEAKGIRKERNVAGFKQSDKSALQSTVQQLRKTRQATRSAMNGKNGKGASAY